MIDSYETRIIPDKKIEGLYTISLYDKNGDEVYQLNLQLFPLTRK